jgi:toxin YhaV
MIVNGWTIYTHPLFLDQLARLIAAVERDRKNSPKNFAEKLNAKLLKAIGTIALERIPQDPTDKRYRLGDTLGANQKHWFRDKFGNGRFRLFFRYDSKVKIIIYARVNDADTLRTYGSKSDAYAVFSSMLRDGNPPDDWERLLAACREPDVMNRATALLKKSGD